LLLSFSVPPAFRPTLLVAAAEESEGLTAIHDGVGHDGPQANLTAQSHNLWREMASRQTCRDVCVLSPLRRQEPDRRGLTLPRQYGRERAARGAADSKSR